MTYILEYECDNLDDICNIFEHTINKLTLDLCDEIATFTEAVSTDSVVLEKVYESFIDKLKKWVKNIILNFKKFAKDIKVYVGNKKRDLDYGKKLRKLQKELKKLNDEGVKKIETSDIWTIRDTYITAYKSISAEYKKIIKDGCFRKFIVGSSNPKGVSNKYSTLSGLDKQLDILNETISYWNERLEEVVDRTVEKDVQYMLNFIDKEINGRSEVTETLNDSITMLDILYNEISYMEGKIEIYGSDILHKKANYLKQLIIKFTNFIKRWIGKAIGYIVFFFS